VTGEVYADRCRTGRLIGKGLRLLPAGHARIQEWIDHTTELLFKQAAEKIKTRDSVV